MLVKTISKLIDDKVVLPNRDQVYLIYDDFKADTDAPLQAKKELERQIQGCIYLLRDMGIPYKIRACTCFEEIVMSFSYLKLFCDPNNLTNNTLEAKMVQAIQSLSRGVIQGLDGPLISSGFDYSKFLKLFGRGRKGKTAEAALKNILNDFMSTANFQSLRIKPSSQYIGRCWFKDCKDIKGNFECSYCRAKTLRIGNGSFRTCEKRLQLFYSESLLKALFS